MNPATAAGLLVASQVEAASRSKRMPVAVRKHPVQRKVAHVAVPVETTDEKEARALLRETQGHHARRRSFAGRVAMSH